MKRRLVSIFLVIIGFLAAAYFYIHRPAKIDRIPIILGHGGMGVRSTLPLNSITSIKEVLSYPVSGTEVDIKITSDGVLVAFHDTDLKRNTECTGTVADMTFNELSKCKNKTWLRSEPIATVQSLLSKKWKEGTIFSLDLKPDKGIDKAAFANSIVETIMNYPQYQFLVEAQDLDLLDYLKRNNVNADLYYYTQSPDTGIESALVYGLNGISINLNQVTATKVAEIKSMELKIMLWGTGSAQSNRLALEYESDIIQTDDVESMMKILSMN